MDCAQRATSNGVSGSGSTLAAHGPGRSHRPFPERIGADADPPHDCFTERTTLQVANLLKSRPLQELSRTYDTARSTCGLAKAFNCA